MGLIFYYGINNKTTVNNPVTSSKGMNTDRLTPQNLKFLQSLGLTVIKDYLKIKKNEP